MSNRWSIAAAVVVLSLCTTVADADTFTVVGTIRAGGTLSPADIPLAHDVQFSTAADTYYKIQVQPSDTSVSPYYILFGPDPEADAGSIGTGIIRESNGNEELAVIVGAAYFVGHHPYGGSQGGSGSGTGTAFVVQGRPDGASDRFIFLEGTNLTVAKNGSASNKKTITSINDYIEIGDDADPTSASVRQIKNLAPANSVRTMLWSIVALAGEAGLDRPVPYGR